jgi:hypothetical protein
LIEAVEDFVPRRHQTALTVRQRAPIALPAQLPAAAFLADRQRTTDRPKVIGAAQRGDVGGEVEMFPVEPDATA